MSQEVTKKEVNFPVDLTEQQRRFCEYLIFNEGRTTHQDAAIVAGYAPKHARQEAYRLMQNPKIQSYLAKRSAEINRSYAVSGLITGTPCLKYTTPGSRFLSLVRSDITRGLAFK